MITFFRSFFQSKIGIAVTLAFLALIAFAFASSDVANTGTFGGVSGGDRVAVVGDEKISTSDLSRAATTAVDRVRQQNPTISMPAFLEQGGLEQVLTQLTERFAISGFANKYGLRAGMNLVNSEILAIPAFRGADGNFDDATYRQAISAQGLSDAMVREDLGAGLLAQQVLVPASFGAVAPDKFASRYASLLKERRKGAIGILPAFAFAPSDDPTDKQLQAFYEETRGDYIRPERRIIRYATFGDEALDAKLAPTEQEIAARYEENREVYAPSEKRNITQLIVPTQQAAAAIATKVAAGGSLEAAASEAGLQTAKVGPLGKSELASQTSQAVANAVFAADRGAIAAPARSGLGFHVARVDTVQRQPGRNLEQARGEITEELRAEKRRTALSDLAASVEDRIDGGSLNDLAKEMDLEVKTTEPITGAGAIYGTQERAPEVLGPALQTAFQMEESEPQLAEVVPGETFLVFEVTQITESAAAPLADIKDGVVSAWKLAEGSKAAKEAVDRILKRISDDDMTLAAAMRAEEKDLPPADAINLTREQLAANQQQQVPPPLALLFSMAEGTSKRLEAPQNAGWFVVSLTDIEAGTISNDDPIFAQTKRELSQSISREYSDQLRTGIRQEVGVERNEDAIEAVRKLLLGEN